MKATVRFLNNKRLVILAALAIGLCFMAEAARYKLIGGTETGASLPFDEAARWQNMDDGSAGIAPTDDRVGADDEYYIQDYMGPRGNSAKRPLVFKFKSLTVKNGYISWKVIGTDPAKHRTTVPLFIWEGGLRNGTQIGALKFGDSGTAWIDGTIQVKTARATPFALEMDKSAWYGYVFDSKFEGDPGTGIKFQTMTDGNNMKVAFDGDNTAYYGNFQTSKNVWLRFKDAAAFGGQLAALDEEALVLEDSTILEVTTPNASLPATLNRGITVHGANVASNVQFRAESDWTLGAALAGEGDIVKTGAGCLTLATDWTLGKLIVKEGSVAFAEGVKRPSALIASGYSVNASYADTEAKSVLDVAGMDGFELTGPIQVKMSDVPASVTATIKVPVFKLKGASFDLRACDITVTGNGIYDYVAPVIEKTGDVQTVYVQILPYVNLNPKWKDDTGSTQYYPELYDVPGYWDDGLDPHQPPCAGKNYRIDSKVHKGDVRTKSFGTGEEPWTFSGDSLMVDDVSLITKEIEAKFRNLCLVKTTQSATYSRITYGGHNWTPAHPYQTVSGSISFFGATKNPTLIACRNEIKTIFAADIKGTGWIKLCSTSNDGKPTKIYLTGNNDGFSGGIIVSSYDQEWPNAYPRVVVDGETTLGGRLLSFQADALTLARHGSIEVVSDATYDVKNRGITMEEDAEIVVDEGVTYSVVQPVTVATATARKSGSGVLACKELRGAGDSVLKIAEGGFKPLSVGVLAEDAGIEFSADGALVVDMDETDAAVRQCGLKDARGAVSLAEGVGKLKIVVRGSTTESRVVGLLTVPDETAASWEDKLDVSVAQGKYIIKVSSVSDGTFTTYQAEISKSGLTILLR